VQRSAPRVTMAALKERLQTIAV